MHRVRATLLNSSLGVTGKTIPPPLCRLACQHHLSCYGGQVLRWRDAGSGPAQPHIPQGLHPVLRSKLCALHRETQLSQSKTSRLPREQGLTTGEGSQPGLSLGTAQAPWPSWALQPGAISPATGSEKESVKKGPKRLAEGCGFWSAVTSGGSTGDLR